MNKKKSREAREHKNKKSDIDIWKTQSTWSEGHVRYKACETRGHI